MEVNCISQLYLLSICNLILIRLAMIPKTPQKKNSLQLDNHDSVNNSFIWSNQSNIQPHLEKSLFKARAEDSTLKNSQAILSKKPVNGILGKKYAQNDNIFKSKHTPAKQYREVVISDEFVRSSKLYKMLKQQVAITDAKHVKEVTELNNVLREQQTEIKQVKDKNHELKVGLWQLRNQMMQLKNILEQQEQQNKKLVEQYQYLQQQQANEHENQGEDEEEQNQIREEQKSNNQHFSEDQMNAESIQLNELNDHN